NVVFLTNVVDSLSSGNKCAGFTGSYESFSFSFTDLLPRRPHSHPIRSKRWYVIKTAHGGNGNFCSFVYIKSSRLLFLLTSTGCPIRWVLYAGKCYFFSAEEKTWNDSQEDCAQSNAYLAVVNNKAELMFLFNRTNHFEYFIGLTQQGSKGLWRWIDNRAYDPDILNIRSRIYDCAVLGLHLVTSAPCSVVNRWICEEKA
uniref:C-type lectin domain-containing protein n=1 Tax=Podarcis muralis TaxID=64176 RepID=A0A670K0U1_PODMU